jgi:hypothetical protein
METALSIYSNIIDGKTPYLRTALLEIEFGGTANDPAMEVSIVVDNKVMLTKTLSTDITKFKCDIPDSNEAEQHEFRIELRGDPTGAMLHIRRISIEGLDLRLTMEDSGDCWFGEEPAIPSEYMGQVGYQSLQFTTPIYPWLLANERKDTYYYPH